MCGGTKEAFEQARPLLDDLAKTVRFIGAAGEAAKVKALVNMVMNINTAGLAEGLGLGSALGLDLTMLREVFGETGAASRVLQTDGEDMQNRAHDCFFSAAHAAKDSGIALALGKDHGIHLPLAEATTRQFEAHEGSGPGRTGQERRGRTDLPGAGTGGMTHRWRRWWWVAVLLVGVVVAGTVEGRVDRPRRDARPAGQGGRGGSCSATPWEAGGKPSRAAPGNGSTARRSTNRRGEYPFVIVSGGYDKIGGDEATAMGNYLAAHGVPPERIIRDSHGVNTYESARFTARLLHERGWRSVCVVTHFYHVPRARLALRRFGGGHGVCRPRGFLRGGRLRCSPRPRDGGAREIRPASRIPTRGNPMPPAEWRRAFHSPRGRPRRSGPAGDCPGRARR